jgi:hypothetical protein
MADFHANEIGIWCGRDWGPRRVSLAIIAKESREQSWSGHGRYLEQVAGGAAWMPKPDSSDPTPIFCTLKEEGAQRLMDDLWNCGVRPTEGAGSAGAMAATQKHLDDMRKLVFEHLANGRG